MSKAEDLLRHAVTLQTSVGIVHVVEVEGLPPVGGFVLPLEPSTFAMVLNAEPADDRKIETFLHELSHVLLGHLSGSVPVPIAEQQAKQSAAALVRLWKSGEEPDREELALLKTWLQKKTEHCPFLYEVK